MPQNNEINKRRTFAPDFKQQIVYLYRSRKRKCDIIHEYDVSASLSDKWIAQATNTGFFREKDNRSQEDAEMLRLRKENQT